LNWPLYIHLVNTLSPSVNFLHVCVTTTYHLLHQYMYALLMKYRLEWYCLHCDGSRFRRDFKLVPNCEEIKNESLDPLYCLEVIWKSLREARVSSYHVIEEELEGRMKVKGRKGIRRKQLLYDSKKRIGYWKLKVDALDCILRKTRFGREYGLVEDWLEDEWIISCICVVIIQNLYIFTMLKYQ